MKQSAGILAYKLSGKVLSVLLIHPGGRFWKNRDAGSWSIPKGEFGADESSLSAAMREFYEETGIKISGKFLPLDPIKIKSGKVIHAYAAAFEADLEQFRSNEFEMEWPPRSGRTQRFPEADRAEYFQIDRAREIITPGQLALLDQLEKLIK